MLRLISKTLIEHEQKYIGGGSIFVRREGDDADYDDREAKEKGSERGEGVVASCFSLPCWPCSLSFA